MINSYFICDKRNFNINAIASKIENRYCTIQRIQAVAYLEYVFLIENGLSHILVKIAVCVTNNSGKVLGII